jgi:hypothetical protein
MRDNGEIRGGNNSTLWPPAGEDEHEENEESVVEDWEGRGSVGLLALIALLAHFYSANHPL